MEAAAHGHSTLGIPQSVGQDFVAADKALSSQPHAPMSNRIKLNPAHKGMFHRDVGEPAGHKITEADIQKGEHSSDPAERKRAQFADNARHFHHGSSHPDPAPQPVTLLSEHAMGGGSPGSTAQRGGGSSTPAPDVTASSPNSRAGTGGLPGVAEQLGGGPGAGGSALANDLDADDAPQGGPTFGGTMHRAIQGLHSARNRGNRSNTARGY
jgi:hypothetical protein